MFWRDLSYKKDICIFWVLTMILVSLGFFYIWPVAMARMRRNIVRVTFSGERFRDVNKVRLSSLVNDMFKFTLVVYQS